MNKEKDNTGNLFTNDRVRDDRSPDRKGFVWAGGKRYWVSSWTKTAADGQVYWTLALTEDTRHR